MHQLILLKECAWSRTNAASTKANARRLLACDGSKHGIAATTSGNTADSSTATCGNAATPVRDANHPHLAHGQRKTLATNASVPKQPLARAGINTVSLFDSPAEQDCRPNKTGEELQPHPEEGKPPTKQLSQTEVHPSSTDFQAAPGCLLAMNQQSLT